MLFVASTIAIPRSADHSAGTARQSPEIALDAAARSEAIDGVLKALNEAYVYPEVARKMEEAVRAHQMRGQYELNH